MTADPVELALRSALARADSVPLRLALGEHLLKRNEPAPALVELEAALAREPANVSLLEAACRAAGAAGDAGKSSAYRLAADALSAQTGAASPPPLAPPAPRSSTPPAPAKPGLHVVSPDEAVESSAPPITFADVAGLHEAKARIERSFLLPLRHPEMTRQFGKAIGGGVVLYGPPGCGKTFLARAMAGEIGARFMNVGLSDVLSMWYGESEQKLHALFENARRRAPTVLFFDEADAIGIRRTELRASAGRNLVNALLSELDGSGGRNDGVFILAATNHPWDLDTALRRPGRFDRLLFVPPPDNEARRRILELKLQGRPTASGIDLSALAEATRGFSGADLASVIDAATDRAMELSVQTGKVAPISQELVLEALHDTRPSVRPWLETAKNYALYANEGGTYDDLLAYLKEQRLA